MLKAIKAFFKAIFGSQSSSTHKPLDYEAIRTYYPANVEGSSEFNQTNQLTTVEDKPKQKKRRPYKKRKPGDFKKDMDQLGLPKMSANDTTKPKKRRGRRPNNAPKTEN